MAKFHSIPVADVRQETPDAVSIELAVPAELSAAFAYKQGQYITFRLMVNGEELRRSYSICSNPYNNEPIRVAVKKVANGRGSQALNEAKPGQVMEVMEPMGNFYTELKANQTKHYVLLAGGSGITPMMSILKSVLQVEPQSWVTLLYGNTNEASSIFRSELLALAAANPSRFSLIEVFEKPAGAHPAPQTGLMDAARTEALLRTCYWAGEAAEVFICGPTPMMEQAEKALAALGVPRPNIHLEYFSAPAAEPAPATTGGGITTKALIICDGDEVEITMAPGQNVLDAALDAGIDAPYACQGGSCCTCRALLVEGKVHMKVNYALLDAEVSQGYILTCQSIPETERIVVDYDRGR